MASNDHAPHVSMASCIALLSMIQSPVRLESQEAAPAALAVPGQFHQGLLRLGPAAPKGWRLLITMAIFNNVLLVKIEGPVWYTIYHHLPVVKGVNKPLY
jgi:hypothetical protein